MRIQLKKNTKKPCVLTCIRDDGSTTWSKLHQGMEPHDLAHYAVEKVLNFDKAFYGMLNEGYDIGDFELPRDQRPEPLMPANLHTSAVQTEHIVNLLTIEFFNTGEDPDFLNSLRTILDENDLPYPQELDEARLKEIRDTFLQLMYQWGQVQEGENLELEMTFQ